MLNRLVLNLSHAANSREDTEFRSRTGLDPPVFASNPILGNIGAPLRMLPDDFYDDIEPEILDERKSRPVVDDQEARLHITSSGGYINRARVAASGRDNEIEEISAH